MNENTIFTPLKSIKKYEIVAGEASADSPISKLKNRLQILAPELDDHNRLAVWISSQIRGGKLNPFTKEPTAFKKVFSSDDEPEIVLKAFFSDSREAWQEEADQEKILREYISDYFLPETEYVELVGSDNPDMQYFIVQGREHGVQLKTFISRVIDLLHTELSVEEVGTYFDENPREWSEFKRIALKKFITSDMWIKAVAEAKILAREMSKLEEKYKVSDLDFFITPEGKIKIIDLELTKIENFKPIEGGYLEGFEELKIIFQLK